ncbi:MAG: hypothetical protein NC400_02225 [Clostridium sp.]|nr:hypothetical protein [Clostridium sp.]
MAVNEEIVTGRKFRKLIDVVNKKWQRISFWHKASDCEFDDGKTAETKVGAIDGITDSLVSTSSNIAASAKALSLVNNNLSRYELLTDTVVNKGSNLTVEVKDISSYKHLLGYFSAINENYRAVDSFMMPVGIFKSLPHVSLAYYASSVFHYEADIQYISDTSIKLINSSGSYGNIKVAIYGIG